MTKPKKRSKGFKQLARVLFYVWETYDDDAIELLVEVVKQHPEWKERYGESQKP